VCLPRSVNWKPRDRYVVTASSILLRVSITTWSTLGVTIPTGDQEYIRSEFRCTELWTLVENREAVKLVLCYSFEGACDRRAVSGNPDPPQNPIRTRTSSILLVRFQGSHAHCPAELLGAISKNRIRRVSPSAARFAWNLKSWPDQHVYSSRSSVGFFGWAWSTQTCASNSFLAPVIPWSTGVHHEQAVQVAAIPLVVTFHSITRFIILCPPDLIAYRFARNRVGAHQMRLRLQTCAWSGCALLRSRLPPDFVPHR
jgi:hypothetical protein